MDAKKTKRLVFLALNAALVCVATIVIQIPSSMGYKNFGDVFVLFAALFFDPITAAISGGIGAALADIFTGYASYAAFTLVIKALEGLVAGYLFRMFSKIKFNYYFAAIIAVLPAALIMAAGYFAVNYLFLNGELAASVASFTGDLLQGAIGVVGGLALTFALSKTPHIETICGSSAIKVYKRYASRGKNHRRALLISDLSGLGRCSLAAQTTVIGASGHEAVCLPTAVLSAQTGFEKYSVKPLPDALTDFPSSWKEINFTPDALLTGYIADSAQVEKISRLVGDYRESGVLVAVDPIMGDDGKIYDALDEKIVSTFRELISNASIVTPNLTEACLLTETDFSETATDTDKKALFEKVKKISEKLYECLDAKKDDKVVVITGIKFGKRIYNLVSEKGKCKFIGSTYTGKSYSGTGDILSSILLGSILNGESAKKGVKKAVKLIKAAISDTELEKTSPKEGINYQRFLYLL